MSKATMFINAHIELDNGDRYEAKIPKSRLDNVIKNNKNFLIFQYDDETYCIHTRFIVKLIVSNSEYKNI